MALILQILATLAVPALGLALALWARDVWKKRSGSGLILLAGLFTIFLGERMLGMTDGRLWTSLAGLLIVGIAVALRVLAMKNSEGDRQRAHRQALIWSGVVLAGLALYGLTLQGPVDALGLDEAGAARWRGVLYALSPLTILIGLLPIFMLDRVLSVHPRMLPAGATRWAVQSGLIASLSVGLVFPINYLADAHNLEWDVAYFRTTRPGTSSLALASTLDAPVTVHLFFAQGSDVGREVEPYFRELQRVSDGKLEIRHVDQALEPTLSEELKVRDNGWVALQQGDAVERFNIGTDLDRSKRNLRQLDATAQEHLLRLTRGARTVYVMTGHGEASAGVRDDPLRNLSLFSRQILEGQNLNVEDFGVAEGSTHAVPDDAAAVLIAGPQTALLPEEVEALTAYWDRGGRLMILAEPGDGLEGLQPLLAHLGVKTGTALLAHAQVHVTQSRGLADRVLLFSNRFGSHDTTRTLSRNSQELPVILPTVVSVQKTDPEHANRITPLIRSLPDTWEDLDGDRQPSGAEVSQVWELAVAITPPEGEARAMVVGDVNFLADPFLGRSRGNAIFAIDGVRWLIGEEQLAGEINNEEDVRIVHTRDEDQLWFYATIFAIPLMVLGFGVGFIQFRRRKS